MKLNGIKKAVGEYNRYNAGGCYSPEYGELMLDKSSGALWTDYHYDLGHNSWKSYESPDIVNLGRMMEKRGVPVTMANVREFVARNF